MSAAIADVEVVPLSEFRGDLREFLGRLRYEPGRGRRRFEGDHRLLSRLRDMVGPDGSAADLAEGALLDVVEDVEEEFFAERWRLTGDDSQPILERLDAHFAGAQAAWVDEQRQRAAAAEVRARQAAERHLDELRGGIGLARQSVAETERQIEAMERDLARLAAELGVEEWPA